MSERRPSIFIPTLYFAEGLPYTIVMMMSSTYFKSLGASNVFIGLATILSLPWTLKFLWAPFVDYKATKRKWIIVCQLVLGLVCLGLAAATFAPDPIYPALALLGVMAIASATHDIAIDGYYLDVLNKDQQAFFVGVRNAFYKVAWLFASGGMVFLAGTIEKQTGNMRLGWCAAYIVLGIAMLACYLFHNFYLPSKTASAVATVELPQREAVVSGVEVDAATRTTSTGPAWEDTTRHQTAKEDKPKKLDSREFINAIASYFQQPGITAIVIYILTFRLGDALLMKMAQPFLLDPVAKGGMGISVQDVGIIVGTVGVVALLVAGILGGWLVSKHGLRRWFVPAAIVQNSALLLYWWLAVHRPSIEWVYVVNTLEHLAYGLGVAAYTVFLLRTVRSDTNKAAHYATATGLMAVGMLLPGMISGFLYEKLGYAQFFLASFFMSIPGMISIFFLPLWRDDEKKAS